MPISTTNIHSPAAQCMCDPMIDVASAPRLGDAETRLSAALLEMDELSQKHRQMATKARESAQDSAAKAQKKLEKQSKVNMWTNIVMGVISMVGSTIGQLEGVSAGAKDLYNKISEGFSVIFNAVMGHVSKELGESASEADAASGESLRRQSRALQNAESAASGVQHVLDVNDERLKLQTQTQNVDVL